MQIVEATSDWRAQDGLTSGCLRSLFDGEVAALSLQGFASRDECRALCDAIRSGAVAGRAAQTSTMNLIGANFSNHAGSNHGNAISRIQYAATKAPVTDRTSMVNVRRINDRAYCFSMTGPPQDRLGGDGEGAHPDASLKI